MQHYKSKIEVQYSYFIEFYLDMIPDYPGFDIDRFHCTYIIKCTTGVTNYTGNI